MSTYRIVVAAGEAESNSFEIKKKFTRVGKGDDVDFELCAKSLPDGVLFTLEKAESKIFTLHCAASRIIRAGDRSLRKGETYEWHAGDEIEILGSIVLELRREKSSSKRESALGALDALRRPREPSEPERQIEILPGEGAELEPSAPTGEESIEGSGISGLFSDGDSKIDFSKKSSSQGGKEKPVSAKKESPQKKEPEKKGEEKKSDAVKILFTICVLGATAFLCYKMLVGDQATNDVPQPGIVLPDKEVQRRHDDAIAELKERSEYQRAMALRNSSPTGARRILVKLRDDLQKKVKADAYEQYEEELWQIGELNREIQNCDARARGTR